MEERKVRGKDGLPTSYKNLPFSVKSVILISLKFFENGDEKL